VDDTLELLTLTLLPGIGPRAVHDLLGRGTLAEALARPGEHADVLGAPARQALESGTVRRRAEEEVKRAAAMQVAILGLNAPSYPALLRRIYDPPAVLYVRGQLLEGEGPAIAIVGARAASPAGSVFARSLARDLAGAGATIVSGLARGIDSAAHLGALSAPGRTVAVLGSGLDQVYPPENAGLARAIVAAGGAVVSEFALGAGPKPGHFPRRNRVIAGWSRAVVVVEAAAKSGALGTARCALEEGREVLATPGHPSAALSQGTNALIRDGAVLVRGAADVAQEIGLALSVPTPPVPTGDAVLDSLKVDAPMSLEQLVAASGRATSDLLAQLSVLEMGRRVRRLPGPLYIRS
jgi:DNA processing protein